MREVLLEGFGIYIKRLCGRGHCAAIVVIAVIVAVVGFDHAAVELFLSSIARELLESTPPSEANLRDRPEGA